MHEVTLKHQRENKRGTPLSSGGILVIYFGWWQIFQWFYFCEFLRYFSKHEQEVNGDF